MTKILPGKYPIRVVSPSLNEPLRCVITEHNFGCGNADSRNTLTKVITDDYQEKFPYFIQR